MTVIGIDNDGCLICRDGNETYNCGETLQEFGTHNLTESELLALKGTK